MSAEITFRPPRHRADEAAGATDNILAGKDVRILFATYFLKIPDENWTALKRCK
jgi:hypothetical protein